jgi:CRP-like cAMP-binding protein
MQDNLVPLDIQQKVRQYIVELWAPFSSEDDAQQLDRLPQPLRTELVWRAAGPTFNLMRLFKTMSPEMLRWIAAGAISCRATAGQNIFSYGDESNGLVYMLQRGRATVHAGWRKVTTVYAPALLGPAALLLPFLNSRFLSMSQHQDDEMNGQGDKEVSDSPRACTHRLHSIIAETNCTMWILRAQDVASLVEVEPELLHDICAEYAAYLDSLQCKQLGPDAHEVRKCVGRWSRYQARSAHTAEEDTTVENSRYPPGDVASDTSLREDRSGEKSVSWAQMHSMAAAAVSYIQESDEGADEARVHNWSLPTVNEKKNDPAVRVSAVAV